MSTQLVSLATAETQVGNPALNIAIFGVFVLITLAIVVKVSRGNRSAAEYYAGGRAFSGRQNGIAIAGDYLSAASFLGIAGAIAINGYDGFLYSIGFLVAWLVALLLVAELLRNVGKYTMADVLSFRLRQRPVRIAAAISTLAVSFFYLLAQMAGAGGLVALLLGVKGDWGQRLVIVIVGVIMLFYVIYGGMKGTTWVQMIKAVLLIIGAGIMTLWVLAKFGLNLSSVLGEASKTSLESGGKDLLLPGNQYKNPIDFISLSMALVLGTAGLPHVLMRFYTVPTSREARRSVVWAIWLIGLFYLFTLVLGYGAADLVGGAEIKAAPGGVNSAAPLLAFALGGEILLGIISGVAFATILAVVAGLTITASASLSHDVYNTIVKDGNATPEEEVRVARIAALVLGAVAIVGGIFALGQNIAFLVALAFAIAASANLPTILYSLFWKRFNTRGALWSIYGGLVSAITLIVFSPVVSGKPNDPVTGKSPSMLQGIDFHWFPLDNPGIVSIPLGFILGYIGTVTSKEYNAAKYAEMEVRSLTGHGAEVATHH
ncbi:solute symporter family protein [Intrasporangium calvum]|uniref:SSS sodium solute transporter superfamily n=1 Tax=Intrasporangium calvum (strain ATCC 23552 / DSM 43043 / JCM 3097 / NBRC 12989 / NCIMB 10167 / NRRL B-3866 / 7 KIP) TaxID=710696 RepID=E6S716_INTC7|nr:cation acetate symporter [Intrasporangium calvum]ADU47911.1 SSS sodium solute transporter superfamily [Intrasporangium calvum DSM 43043]AXG13013.1 cation acetate symporter [Intrasporangium calvum]